MKTAATFFVALIALLHFLIFFAEMFLWTPLEIHKRLNRLNLEADEAKKVAPIVANAGLYNAFVASGLVFSLFLTVDSLPVKLFFLSCVAVAGIYGAITLSGQQLFFKHFPQW